MRWTMAVWTVAVWIAGCAAQPQVRYEYDRDADFAGLRTYRWQEGRRLALTPGKLDETQLDATVRAAAEEALASRGLTPAAHGQQPDVIVTYTAVVEHRVEVDQTDVLNPARTGRRWYYDPGIGEVPLYVGGLRVRRYAFDQGTLTLDIREGRTGELIWRGRAVSVLDIDDSAAERAQRLRTSTAKILRGFPPPANAR